MIVREVRLENVKSYGSPAEVIKFSHGVNAICGANGAGKSTVLEAIGCVLFQHLPYRHQDFVREGESSGTITVVVESRWDQRTYEVMRRVGRGPSHTIYDPDISQNVAHGEENVRDWLHQHLRIDDEIDLRALFIDSVGPPQGTLTAAFLESTQERRSKFDRLLRVAEYQLAFQKLNALESALQDEHHAVEVAVARLEPLTRTRPALESERQEVRDRKYGIVKDLQRYVAERAALERAIEELSRSEQIWKTAQVALDLAIEREKAAEDNLARTRAEHRRAAEAHETCVKTRSGHDQYVKAVEKLPALEASQRKRDQLRQQRHDGELKVQRFQSRAGRLDDEISRAEKSAQDIVALRKKIPDQEAAEKRLQIARDAKNEADQLRKRLGSRETQVKRASERHKQAEQDVAEALAQHTIADELPTRRTNYARYATALAEANRAEGALKALREAVAHGQKQSALLQQQADDLDRRVALIAAAEAEVAAIATLETEHRETADNRAAAQSHQRHAQATRLQVAGGLCPFLHESCRNLRPGVTLETHFDAEIERWTTEFDRLDLRFQSLDRDLKVARETRARAAVLPQLRDQRERLTGDQADHTTRLADSQRKLREAARLASQRTEAERAEQAALRLVREAERAAQEISRLSALRKAVEEAQRDRQSIERELALDQMRIAELTSLTTDLPAAVAALNALGGPREKAAHLEADAAKLGGLQAQHREAIADRDQAAALITEIDRALAPFQDIDRQLDELRLERDQCRADHEAFTAASHPAQALDDRAAALREDEALAASARSRAADARKAMDDAANAYDDQAHRQARERRGELDRAIGDAQARIEDADREEERLEARIDEIHRQELELAALRRQIERIDDESQLAGTIRQSVRAAGPEITRQLLTRISRMASQINAEVLNQSGVELEWTPNYEIVTRRGGETRGFAQLSGGEQMAAALAVRLAILRDLSNVRIAFLDEPTAHLDQERRSNLGDQVQRLKGFDQLVVISHDDTFDGLFGHVIRIGRENGRSRVLDQD